MSIYSSRKITRETAEQMYRDKQKVRLEDAELEEAVNSLYMDETLNRYSIGSQEEVDSDS